MIRSFNSLQRTAVCVKNCLKLMMRSRQAVFSIRLLWIHILGYNTSAYMDMPINHKDLLAQFDTIKKLAEEESCVIVGRCAGLCAG